MCKRLVALPFTLLLLSACDFLEVDFPKTKIASEVVFDNDVTATSAVLGIYTDMLNSSNFASGSNTSTMGLAGLSADELHDYYATPGTVDFELNLLTPENENLATYWNQVYKTIFQANAVVEGLARPSGITDATKKQLLGEALFVRAFAHFYLVNLFGDIPIVKTTDYRVNAIVPRSPKLEVYNAIIDDLKTAQELLGETYVNPTDRVRPNKSTAIALLARVYLYRQNWVDAETQATSIINRTNLYVLASTPNGAFVKNNKEAIWQLRPVLKGYGTNEAYYYVISSYPQYYVLTQSLINAFEPNDKRFIEWVGSFDTGTEVLYFPNKYKIYQLNPTQTSPPEYSIVFRLAEQYLIRAEARAQQDKLSEAIADLDIIRARSGLPLIQNTNPGISKSDLLLAIEQERRIEFFVEWGHRWLDLKRNDRADVVLQPMKSDWNSEDVLYPIPQVERNNNPHLGEQNPGY